MRPSSPLQLPRVWRSFERKFSLCVSGRHSVNAKRMMRNAKGLVGARKQLCTKHLLRTECRSNIDCKFVNRLLHSYMKIHKTHLHVSHRAPWASEVQPDCEVWTNAAPYSPQELRYQLVEQMKWTTRSLVLATAAAAIMVFLLLTRLSKTTQEIFSIPVVPRGFSARPLITVPPTLATPRPPIPSTEVLLRMGGADLEELYHEHAENIEVVCVNKIRLGKADDGGWDVCDDLEYRPQPPCVVYSFGINFDFSFDDDVSSHYNCSVHAFDPRKQEVTKGQYFRHSDGVPKDNGYGQWIYFVQSMQVDSRRRSDLVFFHNNGLDGYDHVTEDGWTMKTLSTLMTELGHHRINILKMDIEMFEFTSLPIIISSGVLKNVDQLLFEIHVAFLGNNTEKYAYMVRGLEIFRGLFENGFRIFYSHRNHYCTHQSKFTGRSLIGCHEVFMVNVNRTKNLHTKLSNDSAKYYSVVKR